MQSAGLHLSKTQRRRLSGPLCRYRLPPSHPSCLSTSPICGTSLSPWRASCSSLCTTSTTSARCGRRCNNFRMPSSTAWEIGTTCCASSTASSAMPVPDVPRRLCGLPSSSEWLPQCMASQRSRTPWLRHACSSRLSACCLKHKRMKTPMLLVSQI